MRQGSTTRPPVCLSPPDLHSGLGVPPGCPSAGSTNAQQGDRPRLLCVSCPPPDPNLTCQWQRACVLVFLQPCVDAAGDNPAGRSRRAAWAHETACALDGLWASILGAHRPPHVAPLTLPHCSTHAAPSASAARPPSTP